MKLFRKKKLFNSKTEMVGTLHELARLGFLEHTLDPNGENQWRLHPQWHDKPEGELLKAVDESWVLND